MQVATAYFNLKSGLHGLGVEHWWPFGHKAAEGLDLVREVFCQAGVAGHGCLLDVSLSQRLVQDWPGPSVPWLCLWPAGFPVWLGTWALSSCAHLVLLGQEAVSTALLSCEELLLKAM